MTDLGEKAQILVRLKTARYALEQATLVAREQNSPHAQRIGELLDEADRLYADVAMVRLPE